MKITLYEILEVNDDSTQETIKKSFRRLSKKYHPDVSEGDTQEKFDTIVKAYEILSNEDLRREYDDSLKVKEFSFADAFSTMLTKDARKNGKTLTTTVSPTLKSWASGETVTVNYNRAVICDCFQKQESCATCKGKGGKVVNSTTLFGAVSKFVECADCDGTGKTMQKCAECDDGYKRIVKDSVKVSLENKFPGETLTIKSKGEEGFNGGLHGDLKITLNLREEEKNSIIFKNCIQVKKKITLFELVQGEDLVVDLPDGSTENIPCNINNTFILQGRGINNAKRERGDIYIDLEVRLDDITSEKLEKLRKFWKEEMQ